VSLPLLLGVGLIARIATADIYTWRDEHGVQHFTNVLEDIPSGFRSNLRTVARERGDSGPTTEVPSTGQASHQAQVVYDPRYLARIYEEGVIAGMTRAPRAEPEPRSVARAAPIDLTPIPILTSFVPMLPSGCVVPGWAQGFDQGRARHRTWRLAQQRCQARFEPRFPAVDLVGPGFRPRRPGQIPWR